MKSFLVKNLIYSLALAAISGQLLLAGLNAFASEATSTNFFIKDTNSSQFSGQSSSTNFSAINTSGEIIPGSASSTNFLIRSGPLDYSSFSPATQNWRFYSDSSSTTPLVPIAAENTAPTGVEDQQVIKLRLTIKETAGIGNIGAKFRLQYSLNSDFSSGAYSVVEQANCVANSVWCYGDGGGLDNQVVSSTVLSDAGSCSGGVGSGCGTHNESGTSSSTFNHIANATTEYDFVLKQSGAAVGTTYFFRVLDFTTSEAVPKNTGESYPSLVTGGATLTFTISGVSSGILTEGITVDVTSTATSIPFGSLSFGTTTEAAQRISVTTNATNGYQVFIVQDEDLLNQASTRIPPVSSSNSSPSSWSLSCASTSTGCYGYHAGDDSLSGGSTRFTADDTYARFETSSREVAWSSLPAINETTDIVFRILARGDQENGSYSHGISYIVVTTF